MAVFHPQPEEINVGAAAELRAEGEHARFKNVAPEQHIAGPRLGPWHDKARRMSRTLKEAPFEYPWRRRLLEMSLYGTEDSSHLHRRARAIQVAQPVVNREFIIVDEGNEFARCNLDRFIPCQCNALLGLGAIGD